MKTIFNKNILLLGLALILPSLVSAQKKEKGSKVLSEKVEVTKSYIPKIGKSSKRDITPTQEDNMQIDIPKLKYTISYKPEKYPFTINYLEIPSYKMDQPDKLYNCYADFMIGAPLSTRANFFYNTSIQKTMIAGVAVNHNGFFGKLENNMGNDLSATETTNDLLLYFQYQKDKLKVKISLLESFDIYNRYGYSNINGGKIPDLTTDDTFKQHFIKTSANVEIGTPFINKNDLDAKFYAAFNTVSDKYSFNESIYQAGILVHKGFEKINSVLEGRLEYLSVVTSGKFQVTDLEGEEQVHTPPVDLEPGDEYSLNNKFSSSGFLSFAPRYKFAYEGVNIDLGVKMVFDFNGNVNNYKQGVTTIIPQAELSYSFMSGAIKPYIKIDGEFINNNYFSLTQNNPYVVQGLTAPNSVLRKYMFGLRGTVGASLTYNLHAGLRQSRDLLMYVNLENGNLFSLMRNDFDNFELGFQVGYVLNSVVALNLDIEYIDYNSSKNDEFEAKTAYGYSPLVAKFGINVRPMDALLLSANIAINSSRTFISKKAPEIYVENRVGTVCDLKLRAEYKISDRFAVSLNGENLLNQKLYEYNNYRGIGINILGGVSYKF